VPIVVSALAITPVKGTRVRSVQGVELERSGARGNRRFFVVDESGRMVNAKRLGELVAVVAEHSESEGTLTLTLPGGGVISAHPVRGRPIAARFFSRSVEGRLVEGPFAAALSEHVGQPVRLVEAAGAVDRGARGAVSLVSRASLAKLAEVAGERDVDARRFRMLIEVDGVGPHEEDGWVGRTVQIGEARVRFGGHVGRCVVTTRDPERGSVDLPTLHVLERYRGELPTTEPLAFGIYGEVLRAGPVRVGDPVTL
jgi:uncharacterized protein